MIHGVRKNFSKQATDVIVTDRPSTTTVKIANVTYCNSLTTNSVIVSKNYYYFLIVFKHDCV